MAELDPAASPATPASPAPAPAPAPRRRSFPVWVRSLVTLAVWAFVLVLVLRFFPAVKVLFLGLLAAAAVAALLRPLADRLPGPRGLRAVIVGVGFIIVVAGLVFLLGWLVGQPIAQELKQWPEIRDRLNQTLQGWSDRLGFEQPISVRDLITQATGFLGGSNSQVVSWTANALFGLLVALAFVFIGSMYFLAETPGRLLGAAGRLLPAARRPALQCVVNDLDVGLRWWLIGVSISMTIVGVASWAGYKIVGLKFAIPLALFAAVSELVPTIGPIVSLVVAVLFATTQGVGQVAGVAVVYVVIQVLESYVILPLVMKRAVDMPPIVTLFSVVLWGQVFGAPGLLLAIPINLVIWSLLQHFVAHPSAPDECHPGEKVQEDEAKDEAAS